MDLLHYCFRPKYVDICVFSFIPAILLNKDYNIFKLLMYQIPDYHREQVIAKNNVKYFGDTKFSFVLLFDKLFKCRGAALEVLIQIKTYDFSGTTEVKRT